jgi:hypothetical protein
LGKDRWSPPSLSPSHKAHPAAEQAVHQARLLSPFLRLQSRYRLRRASQLLPCRTTMASPAFSLSPFLELSHRHSHQLASQMRHRQHLQDNLRFSPSRCRELQGSRRVSILSLSLPSAALASLHLVLSLPRQAARHGELRSLRLYPLRSPPTQLRPNLAPAHRCTR